MSRFLTRSLWAVSAFLFLGVHAALAQAVFHEQASVSSTGQHFGDPVGLQGTLLFVGVPGAGAAGSESGELRLFDVGPPINIQATLVGSDLAAGDHFGGTAAISGDVIVVGADRHAHGATRAGSAYVFRWNGSAWIEEAELLASDRAANDNFGSGVGVSGDRIVVGAPGCATPAGAGQGAIYVFERVAGVWTEVFKGVASDGASAAMGWRVASAGDRVLANAPTSNASAGAVYAFLRSASGWSADTKFAPAAGSGPVEFGFSSSVDGDLVAIGEPFVQSTSVPSGSVHVYRSVGGVWTSEATLYAIGGSGLDYFGMGVKLQGERLLVGSPGTSIGQFHSGAGFLFEKIGGTWSERIELAPSSGVQFGEVGIPVGLDGNRAVIGGANPINTVYSFALTDLVGSSFCAGDGSASACPCANESPAGQGFGCLNGFGWGAALAATGSTSVAADDLRVSVAHAAHSWSGGPYGTPVLLVVGTTMVNGGLGTLAGDGLKCVNTSMVRLGVQFTAAYGALAVFPTGLGALGNWSAGDTRYFQAWYRDPSGMPCGSRFNTTNALEVTFTP
jgi:hypothetical protein